MLRWPEQPGILLRNLDFALLRTFVAIVDAESFSGAAGSIHRTQSAVSQQMRRLEALVGRPLMQRHGRGKRLTEDGQRLLDHARRMVAMNDDFITTLEAGGQRSRIVRIGSTHDMADTALPQILSQLNRRYGRLIPEIHTGRSPALMEMLDANQLDLVVSTRESANHPSTVLRHSPTVWICSGDFVLDRTQPLPLVLSNPPSLFRSIAIDALKAAGLEWRLAFLSLNLDAVRATVRAGLGITARNIEMLSSDMRVLGPADGLPALPDVPFYLHRNAESTDPALIDLFNALRGGPGA